MLTNSISIKREKIDNIEIDLNDVYGAKIIDEYFGEGASKFIAETDKKSDELTKEKNELSSKRVNDGDEDLEKVIALLERVQAYQEILREGYEKFNIS